jgi:hypothetical protein
MAFKMSGIKFFDKGMYRRINKSIKDAIKPATFKEYWPKWKEAKEKFKKNRQNR